jgi:hypothetical protein
MSTIKSSTTTTTAYSVSADTTGTLVIQTGATPTTAVTVGTDQSVSIPKGVGGTPAFSAYASTTTTLSANTWTKINYATENWDTNNNFASSRFTPTVAGYYQINACFGEGLSTATMGFYIAIYKNGATIKTMQYITASAWYTNAPISSQVYLNGSTDYVEIYANTSSAYTNTANQFTNWFDGFLARAA